MTPSLPRTEGTVGRTTTAQVLLLVDTIQCNYEKLSLEFDNRDQFARQRATSTNETKDQNQEQKYKKTKQNSCKLKQNSDYWYSIRATPFRNLENPRRRTESQFQHGHKLCGIARG